MKLSLVLFAASVPASLPLAQTTITVNPGESIQAAITAAQDGDTVLVNAGTYNEVIDFLGKAVTVQGVGRPTMDAAGVGSRVVTFRSGEGPGSVLEGFEITNGQVFGYSEQGRGGGLFALGASPTVRDCLIRDNFASNGGAGVAGDCTLERCVISGNQSGADDGGSGVWGAPRMFDCIVENGFSYDDVLGGGLSLQAGAYVERCVIRNNSVDGDGSAAVIHGPNVVLRRCLMVNNGNVGDFFEPRGTILAFYPALIENCTVSGNGGNGNNGIYGPCTVVNTIVWRNSGAEVWSAPFGDPPVVTYSDIEGGFSGLGNFDLNPLFTSSGNFHLIALSPCIDAGDPTILDPNGTRSDVGAFPYMRHGRYPVQR